MKTEEALAGIPEYLRVTHEYKENPALQAYYVLSNRIEQMQKTLEEFVSEHGIDHGNHHCYNSNNGCYNCWATINYVVDWQFLTIVFSSPHFVDPDTYLDANRQETSHQIKALAAGGVWRILAVPQELTTELIDNFDDWLAERMAEQIALVGKQIELLEQNYQLQIQIKELEALELK